ncbi:MAG: AbrB/MazE/SpoVT family DNA-binding domain-containing protein [Rhodoferax sp.]|uniref:antitoxin n=1 Tax=Rhodoferax sp. TaxID=50421 RepID=UPI003C75A73F
MTAMPQTDSAKPLPSVAKVFTTGRSQAVRLPKAFRFTTSEVTIEKVGCAVILRPKQTQEEWWTQMQLAMDGLRGVLDPIERNKIPDQDDRVSFD